MVVLGAVAVGLTAGTYGIASAASGSGFEPVVRIERRRAVDSEPAANAPEAQKPWGQQRSDETLLSGDAAAKVEGGSPSPRFPSGTIIGVETDADGNAAYEAHMVKADGTAATVYVSKQFEVVKVASGMPCSSSAGLERLRQLVQPERLAPPSRRARPGAGAGPRRRVESHV